MRLVSYLSANGPRLAAMRGVEYVDLNEADPSLPATMEDFLTAGESAAAAAAKALETGEPLRAGSIRLLAPVTRPQKVICVGLNYADHAKETGKEPPSEPVIFNKFPTALAAHKEAIPLPGLSQKVDYEAELVVVIGKAGRHIRRDQALGYVAGYCCGNDISARDWQTGKPAGQWLLGKSFDSFAPVGPALVTADEIPDPGNLAIKLRLNGQVMQDSTTAQFIYPVDELIAYISGICTLLPGDLIFTGTPPGVGVARKPPVFLKPGDIVDVEIEKVGILTNSFTAEVAG